MRRKGLARACRPTTMPPCCCSPSAYRGSDQRLLHVELSLLAVTAGEKRESVAVQRPSVPPSRPARLAAAGIKMGLALQQPPVLPT